MFPFEITGRRAHLLDLKADAGGDQMCRVLIYAAGLTLFSVAGAEYDLWRAFDRAWAGNPRRPPFTNDFASNFIILLLIAGSLAALWVYGERADSGWDRGLWSGFVQWLSLVFVTMLLVFVPISLLLSVVFHPATGIGLFTMAFTSSPRRWPPRPRCG
jgi:hypothetical protein